MTVADAWQAGREHLAAHGIDEAAITAEVLLRHSLNVSRADLYLAWDRPIAPAAFGRFHAYLEERVRGRPVAYITGHREFMGLDFLVDERVLIPRPETETLVEVVLGVIADRPAPRIADVGTGCGAIAISLAVAQPAASFVATDNSPDALDVARANAARHNVADQIRFLLGDLVGPIAAAGDRVDVLACNPPYVAPEDLAGLPREIREFEPTGAVIAPGHAESIHARLIHDAPAVLRPDGWLVMEVGAGQASRVVELVETATRYAAVGTHRDGLGWERVVAARVHSPSRDA